MAKHVVLIPAAGASRRMRGADKLLEDVAGEPCLRVLAKRALASGADVIVTLPKDSPARRAALEGIDVQIVDVPESAKGMSSSLQAGAMAAASADSVMILPGDMPDILVNDINSMWGEFEKKPSPAILRATTGCGEPGHPVIFDAFFLPAFAALTGDSGAAPIVQANMAALGEFALQGERARRDLDSPEDWAEWRANRKAQE